MAIKRVQRGRNHTYTIDGRSAVGVTTAISKGFPKPALMYWAAKCTAQEAAHMLMVDRASLAAYYQANGITGQEALINHLRNAPTRQRDDAAVRGTKVHNIAEKLTRGQDVEVPEELIGHVESAMRFLREWKVKPLLIEKTVGSYRWGFAGTFDLIGEIPDGRRILFDYKTGRSGIFPDVALQLAAYRHADSYVADDGVELPMTEVGIDECKAVWVRADGYDVVPLATDDTVFKAFLHVLQVARTADVMDGWKGPNELPPSP
jgi:hypothetical protein